MTFEEKINQDMKDAMKAQDKVALRGIRAVKQAIQMVKTDGSGREVDDATGIQLVQKLIKQRKESLAIYEEQGREDLALVEREEIAIIERYLPPQLSAEELEHTIRQLIAETGASGMKDMGRLMGAANKALAGKADGKAISEVVKRLLS